MISTDGCKTRVLVMAGTALLVLTAAFLCAYLLPLALKQASLVLWSLVACAPLVPLIPEHEQPFDGGWYSGVTLSPTPACGAKTLYRTTADGYGRILRPDVEVDPVVAASATVTR